uniref:phosphopantetheine-binding protein n=1 Tax=Cognatiluteimonas telluris TaxID=1104775 RepID=UPI00140D4389
SRAPAGAIECQVAALWCELLGLDAVGAEDNFFDLGGHSLLAMQMHARLADCIGRDHDLDLVDVFSHPSITSLAGRIEHGSALPASLDEAAQRAEKRRAALNDNRRNHHRK